MRETANMQLRIVLACLAAVACGAVSPVRADSASPALELGLPFSNHMILQRDVPACIFGKARPGTDVIVSFLKQRKHILADANGRWQLSLDALSARAEPAELTVESGGETLTLHDVLVGEVWIAAGQSNMEFTLRQDRGAAAELSGPAINELRLMNLSFAGQGVTAGAFRDADVQRLTSEKYFHGSWAACSSGTAGGFSAVAYYFGKDLREKLKVPVGVISLAVGGSPAEAWIPFDVLARSDQACSLATGSWLENASLEPWCLKRASENLSRAVKAGEAIPGDLRGPNHPYKPGFLWEAGLARLAPLSIRGFLWYQGESNAESPQRVRQHAVLFPLLVSSWRTAWRNNELPFLYVQLPGMNRPNWPAFRDQQRRFLGVVPHVAMAVTIDVGQANNVHPRDKRPVGLRLSLLAQSMAYGQKSQAYGPMFREVVTGGDALVVRFEHAEGLCTIDNAAPVGFELASEDGRFVPARAEIRQQTVILSAQGVKSPRHARYGWQGFPDPPLNLVNRAGLPASPFSSLAEE